MTGSNSNKHYTTGILPTFTFVVDGPEGAITNQQQQQQQQQRLNKTSSHRQTMMECNKQKTYSEDSITTTRIIPTGPLHIVPSWQPLDANDKPPYSYATLIAHAILSSEDRKLTLGDIYQWITQHYPFYTMNEHGWQNSIRHNLSLNKAFVRLQRTMTMNSGKGSFWTIRAGQEMGFIDKLIKRRGPIRKQLVNLPRPLPQHSQSSPRLGDSYFGSSTNSQSINNSPLFTTFRMTPPSSSTRSKPRATTTTKRKRSMPELHNRGRSNTFIDNNDDDDDNNDYSHDSDCDSGIDVGHDYIKQNKQLVSKNRLPQLKKVKSSPCIYMDHSANEDNAIMIMEDPFQSILPLDFVEQSPSFLSPLTEEVNPVDISSSSLLPFMDWTNFNLPTDQMEHYLATSSCMDLSYEPLLPLSSMDSIDATSFTNNISSTLEEFPQGNYLSALSPCLDLSTNDYELSDDSFIMADWIVQ